MSLFFEPCERPNGNVKVELHLPNYTKKTDLIGATGSDKSKLSSKADLVSLKIKADNLDARKRKTVTADLRKLSKFSDIKFVKKTNHNHLVIKVNIIDTKAPDTSRLVTKARYDSKNKALK